MSLQQDGGLLALMMTPMDPPHTLIVSTAIGSTDVTLQEQRIYCPCASQRSLQLCQLPLLTYSGAPQQKYQHTCNPRPNSYHK